MKKTLSAIITVLIFSLLLSSCNLTGNWFGDVIDTALSEDSSDETTGSCAELSTVPEDILTAVIPSQTTSPDSPSNPSNPSNPSGQTPAQTTRPTVTQPNSPQVTTSPNYSDSPTVPADTDKAPETTDNSGVETETKPQNTCAHTDNDDNGFCDICRTDVVVTLDLYVLNDLHGKVNSSNTQPGIAGLTSYLQNAMSSDEAAVLFASGDMWQGTSESNLTHGMIINDWLSELDCVSMTLGNHEFDWGSQYIANNAENTEFPFLAINVYDRATNTRVEYCEASVVVEIDGLEIGIIGAIGDCYSSISSEHSGDVYFKVGSELTALVRAESERLRSNGVDYIVYSIHDGYGQSSSTVGTISDSQLRGYYDVALSRDGCVDMVFEAHSHQSYVLKDSYGVYHVQGGGDNKGISHAEITVNFANGKDTVNTVEYVLNSRYSTPATHEIINRLLEKYADQISEGDSVLGTNSTYRSYDDINGLVAQLYYQKGVELWGDEYDIVLGGGFIGARSPYKLYAGDVKYGDLYALMPFDNDLVLGKISGYYLKNKFFESTNDKYYIYYEQYGKDVYKNIDNNKDYYIIIDSYTSTYTSNRITEVARIEGLYARDLLAEYVRGGGLQ